MCTSPERGASARRRLGGAEAERRSRVIASDLVRVRVRARVKVRVRVRARVRVRVRVRVLG